MIDELEDLRAFKCLALELVNRQGYCSLDEFIYHSSKRVKQYTKGITKIYEPNKFIDLDETAVKARHEGYDLLSHNGIIYYIDDRKDDNGKFKLKDPIATSLMMSDFETFGM
jgi:hypothetical protein